MSKRLPPLLCLLLLLFVVSCIQNITSVELEGDDAGECADDADNDQDGLFDCNDPDCFGAPSCQDDGDDDDTAGDDDSAAGDDDTAAGDDDTAAGDDDTAAGDDDTAAGDDDTAAGDDDDDDGLPCVDPGYTSSDPCCSVMPDIPAAGQCANQTAFNGVCGADDFCCLQEWEACCVEIYVNDFGANCQ